MEYIVAIVDKANEILRERDESLSIGPSYFMTKDLNKRWFELTWEYSIVPRFESSLDPNRLKRLKEVAKNADKARGKEEE